MDTPPKATDGKKTIGKRAPKGTGGTRLIALRLMPDERAAVVAAARESGVSLNALSRALVLAGLASKKPLVIQTQRGGEK